MTAIHNVVYGYAMSPKQRFQVMLEPHTIEYLRSVQRKTGASIGEQIRRAVEHVKAAAQNDARWDTATGLMDYELPRAGPRVVKKKKETKTERKRAVTRKRS